MSTKILLLAALILSSCGGGLKLAKNPQTIGFVPVLATENAGSPENLNKFFFEEFQSSGVLFPQWVDTIPAFWTINEFKNAQDSSLQWLLSVRVDYEKESREKGSKIPFILRKPRVVYTVGITYRLYQKDQPQYADMGVIEVAQKQSGDYQVIDYDAADPSLSLSGKERFFLRRSAFKSAAQKLIKTVSGKMKVK